MNARTELLETLGINQVQDDYWDLSDDALAVTAALYVGLAAPGRAATTTAVELAEKIIAGSNMSAIEVQKCKLRALKIWKGAR